MIVRRHLRRSGALAAVVGCLLGPPAILAQTAPPLAEEVFKNVKVLRGIPAEQFMQTMGFFSASLGANCTFCHVVESGGNWTKYADDSIPQKQTARRMVAMVAGMNKMYFGGRRVLTCYSCHRGGERPKVIPNLDELYGPPLEASTDDFVEQSPKTISSDQILDKYIQVIGGAERWGALTSYAATGTYQAYDTSKNAVQIFAKAPNQLATVVHTPNGDKSVVYDGRTGWSAAPASDSPVPLVRLTGPALDAARVDAEISFPARIKQSFPAWRVGYPTTIDDRDVLVIEGSGAGRSPVRFYFDKESGLLVRLVRYTDSPVGLSPTRFDFSDYRDVAGVKIPYRWTTTWLDGRSTIELKEIQANAPVDPARFARPVSRE